MDGSASSDRGSCLQVGKDQSAQAFLGQLDKDPQVGSMIDCCSDYELEQVRGADNSIWLSSTGNC